MKPTNTFLTPGICAASKYQPARISIIPKYRKENAALGSRVPPHFFINSPTSYRMPDPTSSTHNSGVLDVLPQYLNFGQNLSSTSTNYTRCAHLLCSIMLTTKYISTNYILIPFHHPRFRGVKVRIEPPTSLFILSCPAWDAIVGNITPTMLRNKHYQG